MDIVRTHQNHTHLAPRIPIGESGWTTPARGVRLRGELPLTHEVVTTGALAASDRPAVACDLTAAYLWSMVVPSGFGLDAHAQACALATVRDGSRHRASGVRGRRLELPPGHVTELNGLAVTTPARTWLDCSAMVGWRDVIAMGDALLRDCLAELHDLERMVIWGRGRRGVRNARAALPVLDGRSESPGESWTRAILAKGRMPRPECNLEVIIDGLTFRLDLGWREARVAVEYDGEEYHGPDRAQHDAWRRGLLADADWTVIVVRKADLARADDLIRAVRTALRA